MGYKNSCLEEFFQTFDSLHAANKQIVISSAKPPTELCHAKGNLISLFAKGLVVDIQPPDIETRMAIVQKKAQLRNHHIPEEIVLFLAHRMSGDIRNLEGALNLVIAYSELSGEPISMKEIMGNIISKL